jgi:hypothetical protein
VRSTAVESQIAIADLIYEQAKRLPEHLAREVLDFVGFLAEREERQHDRDLIDAQESPLKSLWDNPEDEARDRV